MNPMSLLKALVYVVPILGGIILVLFLIIRSQNKTKDTIEALYIFFVIFAALL